MDDVNSRMTEVLQIVREHLDKVSDYTSEQGLQYKILVGDEIVNALFNAPLLPEEFLPGDWKGEELRKVFVEFDKTMSKIARSYVDKVLISS